MKRWLDFVHPFLVALSPIFFLYAYNVDKLIFTDVLLSAAILLSLAALLLGVALLVFRDMRKAALAVSFFLLLFFVYSHLFSLREEYEIRQRYLLAGLVVPMGVAAAALVRTKRDLKRTARFVTIFAAVFISLSLIKIGAFAVGRSLASNAPGDTGRVVMQPTESARDIYYILVDGYASQWELKNFYGNDNKEFLDFLSKNNFYVVPESRSNYAKTEFSLSTILNLDYLEGLSPTGEVSAETINYRELLSNHKVGQFLKSRGYKYIHAGSWWDATYKNRFADVNINKGYMPEFPQLLYKSIEPFLPFKPAFLDIRRLQYKRTLYQFDELEKIPAMKEPTFTFVHFITHSPFVFNEDGSFLENEAQSYSSKEGTKQYLGQILFLNKKLKALTETILAFSEIPPIIVIQSDHGSRDAVPEDVLDVRNHSDAYLGRYLRNFSAYHLPDGGNKLLWKTMTPVNTFRVIFTKYFGEDLRPLPDKSFITPPGEHYNVIDVTGRVLYEK